MNKRYYYQFDRRSRLITSIVITLAVLITLLVGYYESAYVTAWFISLVAGVGGLYVLSIPRFILVGEEAVEIHCVLELTTIRYDDLVSVRKLRKPEMKYCFPLLGSYGFFGYYGYYYNLRYWDLVKVYAGGWGHFVEMEDIYEQKYIVSCADPDTFVADIRHICDTRRAEPAPEATHTNTNENGT